MREGVTIILRRDDGSVLMHLRDDRPDIVNPNRWALITGRVESYDRDPIAAGLRELGEEANFRAKPEDFIPVTTADQRIGDEIVRRSIYLVHYRPRQFIIREEGKVMRFVHPSRFALLNVLEDHREFVRQSEQMLAPRSLERR